MQLVEQTTLILQRFIRFFEPKTLKTVSYTHLRAHETCADLVCRLLLEKKKHVVSFCKFKCVLIYTWIAIAVDVVEDDAEDDAEDDDDDAVDDDDVDVDVDDDEEG